MGTQMREQQQQQAVVHSQVRRIKQEEEDERAKVHETYYQHQHVSDEMRRLLARDPYRQRSRSPLGRAAISISGDS